MLRVAYYLLCLPALLALAGCVVPPPGRPALRTAAPAVSRIAILLPLSGPNAALGRDLLKAAQLALADSGLQLDVRDTGGVPQGAAMAAAASLAEHDGAIIGPLTAGETNAAAGAAGGLPIFAFTSDRQTGRPGVWPLGVTPEQQTQRLLQALRGQDRGRIAAVLPDNAFGNALAEGLAQDAAGSDATVTIRQYPDGRLAALTAALKDASDSDARHSAAQLEATPSADPAAPPTQPPAAPPPFDALMLGAGGGVLQAALQQLPGLDIRLPAVRLIGPATWSREPASRQALAGAWYAAPDPAGRADFERAFTARFGTAPPLQSDVAYDAARLVLTLSREPAMLTRPARFAGIDGLLTLAPDGRVQRSLAVFEFGPNGPVIVGPSAYAVPGS